MNRSEHITARVPRSVALALASALALGAAGCPAMNRAVCGDAVVQSTEACDDGNVIGGDGCSALCLFEGVCGDGFTDVTEECDDGNINPGDGCSPTCSQEGDLPICGNGVLETIAGEQCDDGDVIAGDGCDDTCQIEGLCGNGNLEPGEECDDGNSTDGDGCSALCEIEGATCGNGVSEPGEECDDGNTADGDGCSSICLMEPMCGDGMIQAGEQCDDGAANSDTVVDACRTTCVSAFCGDGVLDTAEVCDDGAGNSDFTADACRTTCILPSCGDAVADTSEACDDGALNSDTAPDACRTNCTGPSCGDGVPDTGELCDAGALNSDTAPDACRTTCVSAGCGDGIVDSGEGCDEGAFNSDSMPDACRTTCLAAFCGDGVTDLGEECDDTTNLGGPGACRPGCIAPFCTDGIVDPGESCDDGNTNNADACTNACSPAGCGDGFTQPPEQCDDMNTSNNDGCINACVFASCGDDFILLGTEECDDGPLNSDTQANACRTSCVDASCGDDVIDAGEACDDGALNSDTIPDACRTDCSAPSCGDGVADSGEGCDDGNNANGDGCSAVCIPEGCTPAAVMPCGGTVTSSNTAAGSTDLVDQWDCATFSSTGPEIVYSFTPDATGEIVALLEGLTADLDLLVIRDVAGACDPDSGLGCVSGGYSGNGGSADELVQFTAFAGVTYYVVVDGFATATSSFTLQVGTSTSHVVLSEVYGGTPDYVEVRNLGGCDVDLDPYLIRHSPECSPVFNFDFPAGSTILAGGVFRMVENLPGLPNEVGTGSEICDFEDGLGHTLLCLGTCDLTSCTNVLDYVRRDYNPFDGLLAGGPACAGFSPGPIDTGSLTAGESINRTSFSGANPTWFASDWTIGSFSRN